MSTDEDSVLILWRMKDKITGLRTTSVLKKSAIKSPPLESLKEKDYVLASYLKSRYRGTLIKIGSEENLNKLQVNPDTEEIISDPRAYSHLMEEKRKVAAQKKLQAAAKLKGERVANEDILRLVELPQNKQASTADSNSNGGDEAADPDEPDESKADSGSLHDEPMVDLSKLPEENANLNENGEKIPGNKYPLKIQTQPSTLPLVCSNKVSVLSPTTGSMSVSQLLRNVTPEIVSFLYSLAETAAAAAANQQNLPCSTPANFASTNRSCSTSSEIFVDLSNLSCYQMSKGKVEVAIGSGIYINKNKKSAICAAAGNDPLALTRELLKELIGEEHLLTMTAKGQNKTKEGCKSSHQPIPPVIMRTVQGYVSQWIKARNANKDNPPPKPILELSDYLFIRCINLYCGSLRIKKTSGALSNSPALSTRSSAEKKKGAVEETDNDQVPCKRALKFGDEILSSAVNEVPKVKTPTQTPEVKKGEADQTLKENTLTKTPEVKKGETDQTPGLTAPSAVPVPFSYNSSSVPDFSPSWEPRPHQSFPPFTENSPATSSGVFSQVPYASQYSQYPQYPQYSYGSYPPVCHPPVSNPQDSDNQMTDMRSLYTL